MSPALAMMEVLPTEERLSEAGNEGVSDEAGLRGAFCDCPMGPKCKASALSGPKCDPPALLKSWLA